MTEQEYIEYRWSLLSTNTKAILHLNTVESKLVWQMIVGRQYWRGVATGEWV